MTLYKFCIIIIIIIITDS